jgi:sec-independent protein translocase protein TatC
MVLTFGVSFELPIVVLGLAALGIVTPQFLNKYRRHAIVLIVIIGAFLTPGDMVWTTIALSVPLYMLYELSVIGSYVIYRRRQRRLHANDDAHGPTGTEAPA